MYWRRRLVALFLGVLLVVGLVDVVGWVLDQVGRAVAATGQQNPVMVGGEQTRVGPSTITSSSRVLIRHVRDRGRVHVVEPGDTLWSIARRIDPGGDPRPVVDRLAAQAGGAGLRPGQRLSLDT